MSAPSVRSSDLGDVAEAPRLAPALSAIAKALAAVSAGYALCARRTRDANVAVAVRSAANTTTALLETLIADAAAHGVDARPRSRTGERMRWEWLASTGVVMDGRSDARLLDECARMLGDVIALDVSPLGEAFASKVRLASAEAWSLAVAVTRAGTPRQGFAIAAWA